MNARRREEIRGEVREFLEEGETMKSLGFSYTGGRWEMSEDILGL